MSDNSFNAWGDQVKLWYGKMTAAFQKSVEDGSSYEFGSFDAGYTAGVSDALQSAPTAQDASTAQPQPAAEPDLTKALCEAATSLETIASLSGRKTYGNPPIETYMDTFVDVRLYAAARAKVAREALAHISARIAPVPQQAQPSAVYTAARAVLDRWNSPKWQWAKQGPTADLMAELRDALAVQQPSAVLADRQALPTDDEIRAAWNRTQDPVKMVRDLMAVEDQYAEIVQCHGCGEGVVVAHGVCRRKRGHERPADCAAGVQEVNRG